jgi:sugar O-acyltransferase (sialic acid O-acetyltransferase NeuD family)
MKPICVFGAGGFAQEVITLIKTTTSYSIAACLDTKESDTTIEGIPIYSESFFDPYKHSAIVAISSPKVRKSIIDKIDGPNTEFITLIHPTAIISPGVTVGKGSIICAFCFISNSTKIGKHTQLNWATTVGHETILGDFVTTAPGVHISGTVKAGNNIYIGTNSAIIDKLTVVDDVLIGAGACVVKSITERGTYVGVPAKKIK